MTTGSLREELWYRPRRRWLALAVPAALAALVLAVPAVSSAPSAAAPHVEAAAAPHVKAVVHIVQRGLVKDCVYFQEGNDEEILGHGVNLAVTMTGGTGNCFNLLNKFTIGPFGTTSYTGYEYQNGDGHCLWDNGGTIDLGAACQAGHPNEEFYGVKYSNGWWTMSVATVDDPSIQLGLQDQCQAGVHVIIPGDCGAWNFP
jgi:hypothetical protein